MATQTDNLILLDLTTGLSRTLDTAAPDVINVSVDWEFTSGANLTVDGNLVVRGTSTTTESETVLIADNHLYLNDGYTTASAETGGLVVNYLPTATTDTVAATGFTAGVPATSNPTVSTTGAATFSTGDLIQISGANDPDNDGLYEVLSHAANVLTIRGVGTTATVEDFTQNQFDTDTTVAGTITQINVSVLRVGTDGAWETASGSTTGFTFNDLLTAASVTLQTAYEGGNTITTDAGNGDITFTGTEDFLVTLTDVDIDVSATVAIDADTSIDIGGDADDSSIGIGTATTAGRAISIGNATGTTSIDMDAGTGGVTIDTADGGAVSIDAVGAPSNLTLTSTAAGDDLTVSVAGATDSSLILSSTGTGADALQITASAGGIVMSGVDNNAASIDINAGGLDYITIDSTDGAEEIVLHQIVKLDTGSTIGLDFVAGTGGITAGDVVTIESGTNDVIPADANSSTTDERIPVGVTTETAAATGTAFVATVPGTIVNVTMDATPAGSTNGDRVFLSETAGQGTLTPPTGGGRDVWVIGYMIGADGATNPVDIIWAPQFVARRP